MKNAGHSVAAILEGNFEEGALRARVEEARQGLVGGRADLALVFMTPGLVPQAEEILEVVRVHGRATLLAGCSGSGVIGNDMELEGPGPALAFALLALPGARLTPVRFTAADLEEANGPGWWHAQTGLDAEAARGWLVFADPFSVDIERWAHEWNEAYPGVPAIGGLAGGTAEAGDNRVFLNGTVHSDGGIAVAVGGAFRLEPVVSQGCTPIGRPWTVTAAERNFVQRIGNLPALSVLQDTFNGLTEPEKARAGGNIFVGLAVNEYQEEHRRGDFLVRNLLGADPNSGVVAVGARVRVGQTLQFQFRDGPAAAEDLATLLARSQAHLAGQEVAAACLCSCAGRGRGLFGKRHQDAQAVRRGLREGLPVAGFFCNGEIGPVGDRNFVHGYTAAVGLFVGDGRQAG